MTASLLTKLYSHSVEVQIWNKKDHVSGKAMYDRPKAFPLEEVERAESSRLGANSSPSVVSEWPVFKWMLWLCMNQ